MRMLNKIHIPSLCCWVAVTVLAVALTATRADISRCQPSTIFVDRVTAGDTLVVHTDEVFSDWDESAVKLNGVLAVEVKADQRGCLVARFDLEAILKTEEVPIVTLTIGDEVVGTATLRIKTLSE
jgi:hypothetical protein